MSDISKAIGEMSQEELLRLKQELDQGKIVRLVSKRISQVQGDPNSVCPVCHSQVDDESMTLVFGPAGLRQKASFCAADCLKYFLDKMRPQGIAQKEEEQ